MKQDKLKWYQFKLKWWEVIIASVFISLVVYGLTIFASTMLDDS